mgnify:FL=1
MIASLIRANIREPYTTKSFLEIGCGTGIVMAVLEGLGFIATGLDVNTKALSYAVKRTKGKLIRQSIFGFKPKKYYDIVGAFDVLEHIQDDMGFLRASYHLLSPDGYLLLTVPAGMHLWSPVDVASGHVRRYAYEELSTKLKEAGFTIQTIQYWNSLLLPVYKLWHQKTGDKKDVVASHLQKMPYAINMVLKWIFLGELFLSRFIQFPRGATLVVCARKGNVK